MDLPNSLPLIQNSLDFQGTILYICLICSPYEKIYTLYARPGPGTRRLRSNDPDKPGGSPRGSVLCHRRVLIRQANKKDHSDVIHHDKVFSIFKRSI